MGDCSPPLLLLNIVRNLASLLSVNISYVLWINHVLIICYFPLHQTS